MPEDNLSSGEPVPSSAQASRASALGTTRAGVLEFAFDDPTPTEVDQFGFSVALSGNLVLIGAPQDDTQGENIGQAHLFDVTTGDLLHTFDDPTPTTADNFGFSVALDGDRVVIGAPNDDTQGTSIGQAHLFDARTGDLLQTFDDPTVGPGPRPISFDQFGSSVAVSGERVLIGAPFDDTKGDNVGQAYLFDATTGDLIDTYDDPNPHVERFMDDLFGAAVALDGDFALVGTPRDQTEGPRVGQAHVFDATSGALQQTLDDPTPWVGGQFGTSVALDAGRALVGALTDSVRTGEQAHLFAARTGTLLTTFQNSLPSVDNGFGVAVGINGDLTLIGAPDDDTQGANAGQAYLFDTISGERIATLANPAVTDADRFGAAVAIEGDLTLIGAPDNDTKGTDVGRAYLSRVVTVSPPVAVDDTAVTGADTPVRIDVLANDSDPDNDALTVAQVTNPANGTARIADDGRIVFTPDAGFTGQDSFDYTVSDGRGGTATASVTVRSLPVLSGTSGDDVLTGGAGAEVLRGLGGNDRLFGGPGDDSLDGAGGADFLRGDEGADTLDGGIGHDTMFAGQNDDAGDLIRGGPGNDVMGGGPGDDTIFGGPGTDTAFGGNGRDFISMAATDNSPNTVWAGNGIDTVEGGDGSDVLGGGFGGDEIRAGAGDDTVYGGPGNGADDIDGGAGNDEIFAGGGGDAIRGGAGNDTLFNGTGNDTSEGGVGDDLLWGGPGDDLLTGGAGADVFAFVAGNGSDTITDFENGVDHIRVKDAAQDFSDVTVTASGGDAVVAFADVTLTLQGTDASLIGSDDFLFV